ncbi:polyamine aminopropyltransferase [Nanoarchaeota archaeon]
MNEKTKQLKEKYEKSDAWGLWTSIDMKGCNPETIRDAEKVKQFAKELCELIDMKRYGETVVVDFGEDERVAGFSMTQLIETSLVSGHFANKTNSVYIDIFSCKWYDPQVAAAFTKKFFGAEDANVNSVIRSEVWFEEAIEFAKGSNIRIQIKEKLFSKQSDYQLVEVYETVPFGKMMVIDGMIMMTEADEFCYHEMISHVALCTHPNPKKVLVVGAGDGGVIREVIKHEGVELIDHCEIDEEVINASKEFFPEIAQELDNPKVNRIIQDAVEHIKNHQDYYDVILVDSTDPVGPAEPLFRRPFYEDCKDALNDTGILVTQAESIFYHKKIITELFAKTEGLFPIMKYYYTMIPTYPSGMIGFTFCSKKYHPLDDFNQAEAEKLTDLQYYNKDIHKACFALPTFAQKFIG